MTLDQLRDWFVSPLRMAPRFTGFTILPILTEICVRNFILGGGGLHGTLLVPIAPGYIHGVWKSIHELLHTIF
jgi:hypothetical protein